MRKLNEILVKTGREAFYEIVPAVVHTLIGSAVLIPILVFLPVAASLILLPLLYMPLVYGAFYAYHRRTLGEPSGVRAVLQGASKGFVPAVVFGLFCSLLMLILVSTWWYYGGKTGVFYMAIAVFQTYFVIMALVSQFYALQLVLQRDLGIFRAMGESVKLMLRHPGYTIGAFFQALVLGVLLTVTVVGVLSVYAGLLAVYLHQATYNVLHPDGDEENEQEEGRRFGTLPGNAG
ncbi:hypothetical protein [Saccharibacillus sacchari]|uniref:Uncharacterized protein n=1 Tax=Saccharibacillus sacchari TaxID=456493 RepID=A0ACC6PDB3_9BACL